MRALLAIVVLAWAVPAFAQPVGPDRAVADALRWAPEHQHAADILSTSLVGAAVALPCLIDRSWECAKREGLAVGSAYGLAQLAKVLVHRDRPNGVDSKSFYSMHTAIACAAVLSSTHKGELWALCPSVAYTRIASDWHYLTDVAAGAGTAAAISYAVVVWVRW